MDDLNKQQLVLLVILVSFVTSIATGIITVSLLNKAPVEVTQTINKIIERTVETVVPENISPQERVVTVRETVVVTEEDRIVEAISKNKESFVRIFSRENSLDVFQSVGVIVTSGGKVLASADTIHRGIEYKAVLSDGSSYSLSVEEFKEDLGIVYLQVQFGDTPKEVKAASLSSEDLKLGQTIILIAGKERNLISTGLVADLVAVENSFTTIDINANTQGIANGTMLLNLSGDIVGIFIPSKQVFVPTSSLVTAVAPDTSDTASAGQAVE